MVEESVVHLNEGLQRCTHIIPVMNIPSLKKPQGYLESHAVQHHTLPIEQTGDSHTKRVYKGAEPHPDERPRVVLLLEPIGNCRQGASAGDPRGNDGGL